MRTPLLLLLALPACSDTYNHEPDPGFGELGIGVFLYECPATGDSYCDEGSPAKVFPPAFAVGGRIHLQYDWKDDSEHFSDPLPQLQTASSALLARENDGFTALAPGYAAVLAVTGNNAVVDLRHLHIRPIDSLKAAVADDPQDLPLTELELGSFDSSYLQAYALDTDDVVLGGVLGFTWVSADPEIVRVAAGADTGYVKLEAGGAGETTVTLTLGERTLPITVRVGEFGSSSGTDSDSTGATDSSSSSGDTDATGTDSTDSTDSTGSSGGTDSSSSTGDSSSSTGGAL